MTDTDEEYEENIEENIISIYDLPNVIFQNVALISTKHDDLFQYLSEIEDSFNWDGDIILAAEGDAPADSTVIGSDDVIASTLKTTTGYFTGDVGTLAGSNLATASLTAGEKLYYYNLQFSSEDVHTPGDELDVLVAMNPAALKVHLKDLKENGILMVLI